ncbi:Rho termination factor N-terminal domain-containing protein [Bacillus sinesaloumensis]|uniref:Rho termination factor N-terminal domain-containing protein n=1 Tax=Litchfieldia sinesaloumensis TaxID=1926280 RepID=UPI001F31F72A|nr:Rho termination factor N-terminal domain-containing protein [Bacillus sinesaloumensis]
MNRQLENTLGQTLVQRQDTKDREEKQNQKYWSEICVPLRINEGLSTYTKSELDEIRRYLKIKNASSLKKADLIERFQEEIPELLKNVCLNWDTTRFSLLVKIAQNGGYIEATEVKFDQIKYLRDTGLVFTGTLDGKRVMAVPEELIEEIITLEKDVHIKSVIARNTDWIKLTHGLLYYYGTLKVSEMISLLEKYTNESVDLFEYNYVIHEAMSFNKGIVIDNEGYSNARVVDFKKIRDEQQARNHIFFYPFTKEQLLEAGEPGFVDRNRSYSQVVNLIKQNFGTETLYADRIAEECVYLTKNGHSLNDVLQSLSQILVFENEVTLRTLMDKVVHLMNNTREWALKGHTSVELRNLYETPSTEPTKTPKTKVNLKIGRNEPCPCLSGKKYKKCCGR